VINNDKFSLVYLNTKPEVFFGEISQNIINEATINLVKLNASSGNKNFSNTFKNIYNKSQPTVIPKKDLSFSNINQITPLNKQNQIQNQITQINNSINSNNANTNHLVKKENNNDSENDDSNKFNGRDDIDGGDDMDSKVSLF